MSSPAPSRNLPWPDPAPVVHDMRGSMGYPLNLIMSNGEREELLVEHYNRDANASPISVKPGDQMLVGWDGPLQERTYWVVKQVPHKERPGAFVAWLAVLPPRPVTVMGERYP